MISVYTQQTDSPQQQVGLGELDTRENRTISYSRLLLDQLLAATMNFLNRTSCGLKVQKTHCNG